MHWFRARTLFFARIFWGWEGLKSQSKKTQCCSYKEQHYVFWCFPSTKLSGMLWGGHIVHLKNVSETFFWAGWTPFSGVQLGCIFIKHLVCIETRCLNTILHSFEARTSKGRSEKNDSFVLTLGKRLPSLVAFGKVFKKIVKVFHWLPKWYFPTWILFLAADDVPYRSFWKLFRLQPKFRTS